MSMCMNERIHSPITCSWPNPGGPPANHFQQLPGSATNANLLLPPRPLQSLISSQKPKQALSFSRNGVCPTSLQEIPHHLQVSVYFFYFSGEAWKTSKQNILKITVWYYFLIPLLQYLESSENDNIFNSNFKKKQNRAHISFKKEHFILIKNKGDQYIFKCIQK